MSLGPNQDTLITITGASLTRWSARGLTQVIVPIDQSKQFHRTINGKLRDVSDGAFRKYATSISCKDQRVPAIDGVWPGMKVIIECCAELAFPVGGTAQRPVVSGSTRTENGFVFYRPILEVILTSVPDISFEEWAAEYSWQLEGEEE